MTGVQTCALPIYLGFTIASFHTEGFAIYVEVYQVHLRPYNKMRLSTISLSVVLFMV